MPAARLSPPRRRTQTERREGTIRKLLDAATDTLIERGYAGASVQEICERAQVSQGGLFRHFPTREALMVAVGEDVGRKILGRYRREFEALREREDPMILAIRLVRDACRSRLNQAWYELSMAARTNVNLRRALQAASARYYDDIEDLARQLLPELAARMGDRFRVLVDTIIAVFDGEVVHRFVLKKPEVEEARLELLAVLARTLAG
jgi:AcrR family transcriptional regulator